MDLCGTFGTWPGKRSRRWYRTVESGQALDVLLAGLIKTNVPVSPGERYELAALLEATGQKSHSSGGQSLQARHDIPAPR